MENHTHTTLEKKHLTRFLKWCSRAWFTTPGWMVKKLTKQDILHTQLKVLHIPFTVNEVMRIKQFFCNIIFLIFFIDILITGKFIRDITFDFTLCALVCKLPEMYFQRTIIKRQKRIQRKLPNFIDSLTLAIESGLNFNNAFAYIGAHTQDDIGKEAIFTQKEIAFGIPEEKAITHMAERIQVEELSKFVSAINQAKKLGVSIAKTLRIQSGLIRTRQRQRAEELSRTASVKISIPLVFFIFPSLLIVYLAPGLLRLMGQA